MSCEWTPILNRSKQREQRDRNAIVRRSCSVCQVSGRREWSLDRRRSRRGQKIPKGLKQGETPLGRTEFSVYSVIFCSSFLRWRCRRSRAFPTNLIAFTRD